MNLFREFGSALSRVAGAIGNAVTVAANIVADTIARIVAAVVDLFDRLFRQPSITVQ